MRSDPARVRAAKIVGSGQRLRHLTITRPEQLEELRRVWPELVERLERVGELVNWERPPD